VSASFPVLAGALIAFVGFVVIAAVVGLIWLVVSNRRHRD
jgi:hypothetical protein